MLTKLLAIQFLVVGCMYLLIGIVRARKRAIVVSRAMNRCIVICAGAPSVIMGLYLMFLRISGYETDTGEVLVVLMSLLAMVLIGIGIIKVYPEISNTTEEILKKSLDRICEYTWEIYQPSKRAQRLRYWGGRKRWDSYLVHIDAWDCDLEIYIGDDWQTTVHPHGSPPSGRSWDDVMFDLGDLVREYPLDSLQKETKQHFMSGVYFLLMAVMYFWEYIVG